MKHKWFFIVCIFLLFSCVASKEKCIFEYEYYINKIAKEHSSYTKSDWLKINNKLRRLQSSLRVYEKRMSPQEKMRVLKAFNIYALYKKDAKPPFDGSDIASMDGGAGGGIEDDATHIDNGKTSGGDSSVDIIDDRVKELKKITEQQKELFLQLQQLRKQIEESSSKNTTPKQQTEKELLINKLQNEMLMEKLREKKAGRKEIHGAIKVLVFPTNFNGQRFKMNYGDLKGKIETALNVIRTQAKRYGENISIDYEFRVQHDNSYVSIRDYNEALKRYAQYARPFSSYDLVSIVYAIDVEGRSYCGLNGSLGKNTANAIIWYKHWDGHSAGTLAHELFHTMGADDLYYEEGVVPKEVEDNFVKLIGDSIMIHGEEDNPLDPINAWLIGWNNKPELWYAWFVDRRNLGDVKGCTPCME
ncbi:MAG: hypothetical protein ACTTJ6_03090 [Treponema sp.]